MPVIIDELDKRILGELQKDGRTPLAKLADDIGKPRTTIMNRVQKLEEGGIIKGYRAILSPYVLGFSMQAYVLITVRRSVTAGSKPSQVILAEKIIRDCDNDARLPWIEEANVLTGQYDIMLKVWVRDLKQLSSFLLNYLPTNPDIIKTETMVVLEEVAIGRERLIPLDKVKE